MTPETIVLRDGSQVVLIHYAPQANTIACMPGLTKLCSDPIGRAAPHMRSDEKSAVTCPTCKQTVVFTGVVPSNVVRK